MVENQFANAHHYLIFTNGCGLCCVLEASPLPLLDSTRMDGAREAIHCPTVLPPLIKSVGSAVLC